MRGKRRQKELKKKKLLRFVAISVGALLLLFVAAGITVKAIITEKFLVEEIEASINSDVEIGDVSVSVFSFPARITLSNVTLSPRSTEAEKDASLEIERVDLKVSLLALLTKQVNVKSITVSGADITTTYREDGSTSIEELFSKPKDGGASENKGTEGKGSGNGFNAFEQADFVATLGSLKIEHSRVNILLEEMDIKLMCSNLTAELSEIRVDPNRLQETDAAHLSLSVDVRADSVGGWPYGEMFLTGDASARIFNPQTGEAEPDIEGDFSISRDSWLNTRVPFINKAWSMLGMLEKVGVKVAKLPERATFGRSEAIAAHYHKGKIKVRKPLSIWVGDWELAVIDGSWLDFGTDLHEIQGELLASESASGKFLGTMEKGISYLPKEVRPAVVNSITDKLYRTNRLVLPIQSTEEFSDPKIRLSGPIPDLAESAKDAGKKLLEDKAKGLLKGLLDRD
ncbi:MAG: AsmA family protein [Akkermansiaceae bacterium]